MTCILPTQKDAASNLGRFRVLSTLLAFATATLLVVAGVPAPAQAVHDTGKFELDGNIASDGTATWDWGNLFGAAGNRLVTPDPDNGPLLASAFVSDSAKPDNSYFTSNKDIQPIASGQQHWGCDPINNPLAKDDLLNAYAALVQVPAGAPDNAGHTVLYLGSERGSNNGTSYAGFWLLKNSNVGCTGTADFSGSHTNGDILVVSDYTNGGGTQDVSVYKWVGDDATGGLVLQSTGGVCDGAATDNACAIANAATITSAWSPTSHAPNTFVEAGLDLNVLLGSDGGCFTTFMAETRSSDQLTATLKDFAGGQFNTCPPAPITTAATPGGSTVAPGTAQTDVATLSAVGGRPLPTGSVKFFLCQPADVTAAGCPTGGTQVGGAITVAADGAGSGVYGATSASTSNTNAVGKYCWRAEYTPDSAGARYYLANSHTNSTTECFTVVHASPTITTQIAVTGANAPGLGFTTLGDTATLHDFVPGTVAGGTVTFKLYDVTADPGCTGSVVFQTTGTLNASGVATTSATYTPTAAHTYTWIASYGGNSFNDPVEGLCSDANESATIVGAQIDVAKSANPPGPVSAGETIGFDITVSNAGSVPATGTTVTDVLPATANGVASGDLNWSLSPAYTGCSIAPGTGVNVGHQVLSCSLGTVAGNTSLPVIHVQSATTPVDCGVVSNKATVATTNGTGGDSDIANVTIRCADLSLTKTADAASVSAGSQIGFTITASNSSAAGTGTASGVVIDDPLPSGSGVDWSIASGPANCSITGSVGSEVLHCTAVSLAPGASEAVHVVSGTSFASCAAYPNTATLTATNHATLTASATTTVRCPDLTLTKTADAASVDAGSQIGFTVTASNSSAAGTGTASGVVIDDPLPAGSGVDWSIESGAANCSITGAVGSETLHCTAVSLAPGASESVHVVSGTTFASCQAYPNTASLTATNHATLTASATTTVKCPALSLTKTADAASVDAGSQIGFTVTASNSNAAGTGTASGVVIDDPLPSGSGVDWSIASGPANCSITGAVGSETLHCTAVSLAPGASESVHVVSGTTFASCKAYPNTASLTASNHPSLTADATTTVRCANLSLTKTADAASVDAGSQIGFTVTASNSNAAGTGTATGVVIDDPLPAGSGVDWSIASGPANCSITGAVGSETLHCTAVSLAPGASESVHVVSGTTFASCKAYPNTASLTATNAPSLTANATTTVLCSDLSITKTADAASVDAGQQIGFTVTATNSGDGDATGVVIDDPLPAGSGVDWSIESGAANCSITGAVGSETLHCTAVTLAPGADEVVHVVSGTTFASCQAYPNTATLTASNHPNVTANATTSVLCADLSLTKTADAASVDAGQQIGFTVTATNSGSGDAAGVVIDDLLPAGSGVNWSIESGPANCSIDGSPASQTLHCTAVTLAPGASESVHVVSGTSYSSCQAYPNTANLTASNHPSLTASASTTVLCPDLSLTKTADAASVNAGSQIGFTITAANSGAEGTGTASGVVIDDPLPAGADVAWSIASGPENCSITGSPGGQTLHCTAVTLAPGASESVHVVSGTSYSSCKAYPNTASLASTNHPSLTADATTTVLCADLSITKTADAASVDAGSQIGFTITASNSDAEGTGTASGVVIDDPLPAGSGVDWSIASGPANCSITGSVGSEVLHCAAVSLAPGASESVHVVSATTMTSCQAYPNTATLAATNAPSLTASATTTVANCIIVSPPSPPQHHPSVLPNTGGPDRWLPAAGLALLLAGVALVAGDRRRRHRS